LASRLASNHISKGVLFPFKMMSFSVTFLSLLSVPLRQTDRIVPFFIPHRCGHRHRHPNPRKDKGITHQPWQYTSAFSPVPRTIHDESTNASHCGVNWSHFSIVGDVASCLIRLICCPCNSSSRDFHAHLVYTPLLPYWGIHQLSLLLFFQSTSYSNSFILPTEQQFPTHFIASIVISSSLPPSRSRDNTLPPSLGPHCHYPVLLHVIQCHLDLERISYGAVQTVFHHS
jgi:hypothetical protein